MSECAQEPVNYKVPGTAHLYPFSILGDFLALRCIELCIATSMDSRFRRVITSFSNFLCSEELPVHIRFLFVSEGQLSPNCSLNSVFELAYMLKCVSYHNRDP